MLKAKLLKKCFYHFLNNVITISLKVAKVKKKCLKKTHYNFQ